MVVLGASVKLQRPPRRSETTQRRESEPVETTRIREAVARIESILDRKPGYGEVTDQSVTTVVNGVRCSTDEGRWHVESDLPKGLGGTLTGPTPGTLARAALGSCLAMGYVLRAAKDGVELTSVRVTVETDSAVAGMMLPDSPAPPGYREVRYHVEIESPAAEEAVRRLVDAGDLLSPLLDVFARANTMRRTLSVRHAGEGGA
jgi:uncharacterized OsmC-like protein